MNARQPLIGIAALVSTWGCASHSHSFLQTVAINPVRIEGVSSVRVPNSPARPWSPPKNDLPPDFVDAVKFLQSHGLADPRGGKFVQVHSGVVLTWQGLLIQPSLTYGWMAKLPSGKTTLACVDGLTYDLTSKSRIWDLKSYAHDPPSRLESYGLVRGFEEDPQLLVPAPSAVSIQMSTDVERSVHPLPGWRVALPEENFGSRSTSSPEILAGLYLIDGYPDLSKEILARRQPTLQPVFLTMARALLKAKWICALDAYTRGKDRRALELFEDANGLRQVYTDQTRELLRHKESPGKSAYSLEEQFAFLDQAPQLIEETRRRLKSPKRSLLPASGRHDDISISKDIEALEDCGLGYSPYTADVSDQILSSSHVLGALVQKGPDAVMPLIETVADDPRLSRRINRSGEHLRVVPVRELALRAINEIAGTSFHLSPEGLCPPGDKLRNWWADEAKLNPGERTFRMLADDHGDSLQWLCAAKKIAGIDLFQSTMKPVERRWAQLKVKSHSNPSATDLMCRRVNQILEAPSGRNADLIAKMMVECLWTWDRTSSRGPLKMLSEHLLQPGGGTLSGSVSPQVTIRGDPYSRTDPDLLTLFERRAELGETSVLPTYRNLLVQFANGKDLRRSSRFVFFYNHRNDPGFSGLAKELFLDPLQKDMNGMLSNDPKQRPLAFIAMWSPLMNLPEEQDAVIELLQNRSRVAKVIKKNGVLTMYMRQGYSVLPTLGTGTRGLNDGATWDVRVCDEIAARLLETGPTDNKFRNFWPQKWKDNIIQGLIDTLKSHPAKYWPNDSWWI